MMPMARNDANAPTPVAKKHVCNKLALLPWWNPYLCKDCFKERNYSRFTEEQREDLFNRAVAEHRLPRWSFNIEGEVPWCGCCGKQGDVYG